MLLRRKGEDSGSLQSKDICLPKSWNEHSEWQPAAAACSVAMSTNTELAASMQLANYPAVITFSVATHRSQLKARTPLARNTGHSTARSVAKASGPNYTVIPGVREHILLSKLYHVFDYCMKQSVLCWAPMVR